jgi:hypothetical protein
VTRSVLLGWAGVAACTGAAVLAALVESLLIPLYVGSVLVPLAPVLAVVGNIVLPSLGRRAVDRTAGAVVPFVGWLITVIALSGIARPEGDVIYPGGGGWLPWVSYGVILGGGSAGVATIVLTTPGRERVTR